MASKGDLIAGRYELVEPLGRGGMAVVWRARDTRLERDVALKLVAPHVAQEAEFLMRFFSEAQSAARINHPHVVSVLDFGEGESGPFLAMEYVAGGSLADLPPPVLPERALEIVAEAARGAGAAHRLGIVHRDIKPANILLTEDGRAKLADFGIAWAAGSEKLTATGAAIGSPHYISPEQATGRGAVAASDVYSFGVVLYELLTGRKPFEGTNVMAIAVAHVESHPEPPSARNPELDPQLDDLVMRCLAKDPKARFADGAALAQALSRPSAAASTIATPAVEGDGERRPSRALAVAGLVATLLLAALAAFALSSGRSEPAARATGELPKVRFEAGDRQRSPAPEPSSLASAGGGTSSSPSPTESPSPAPSETPGASASPQPSPTQTPEPSPEPTSSPQPTEPSPEPTQPSPTAAPDSVEPESPPTP